VLGGGNTAMDCCRSARRLGASDVKVIVRSGFDEMKASPWEKEDAQHEGIPIINFHVPKAFMHEGGKLVGMSFEIVQGRLRRQGPAQPGAHRRARRGVRLRRGADRRRPGERLPLDRARRRHRLRQVGPAGAGRHHAPVHAAAVFFGGDAAFGPKNIITAVAHGHEAAVSIDRFLHGEDVRERPPPHVNLVSQKMGIHEWSYDNAPSNDRASRCPGPRPRRRWPASRSRSNWASPATALKEAQRCLNCDVQTVFADKLCIECDACVDICPMDCITFTDNGDEADLRTRLKAPATNTDAGLYVSAAAEDHARDGQGRGRVPALRPVRRALPDGRLGHAEVPVQHHQGGPGLPRRHPKSKRVGAAA
jgi:formate dehydrogenase beta subunit